MNRKLLTTVCLLFSLAFASAQEKAQEAPEPSPEDLQKMMAAYMEMIKPGAEHEEFKAFVGKWNAKGKMWMDTNAPPLESVAEVTFELALGGRYLFQHYESAESPFGPYKGMGVSAYDKGKKEYVHTWMDTAGTGIMVSTGKMVDGVMTLDSEPVFDPMSQHDIAFRTTSKFIDDDNIHFEMHTLSEDGKPEFKVMEIEYMRAK